MSDPVFTDPAAPGVTIPLSTIVGGSETGVLQYLRDGLTEAQHELALASDQLGRAREVVQQRELALARAEAKAASWRTAHEAAKTAFGR